MRQWRFAAAGRYVVVTNTTYQAAPWADALVFVDRAWWRGGTARAVRGFRGHGADVRARFAGEVFSMSRVGGVAQLLFAWPVKNSGVAAVALAQDRGAARVTLLGFDLQHTGGRRHWHGDHPKGLGNAGSLKHWPAQFAELARRLHGLPVVNATRETALQGFPRASLEECLA